MTPTEAFQATALAAIAELTPHERMVRTLEAFENAEVGVALVPHDPLLVLELRHVESGRVLARLDAARFGWSWVDGKLAYHGQTIERLP